MAKWILFAFVALAALPLKASETTCRADQLAAAASLCNRVLTCESNFVRNPARDPDSTRLNACLATAETRFAAAYDRALAKEARRGGTCTLTTAAETLAEAWRSDLLDPAEDTLSELIELGTASTTRRGNALYAGFLSGSGELCRRIVNAQASNIRSLNRPVLFTRLDQADRRFFAGALNRIKAAAKPPGGVAYQGKEACLLKRSIRSFTDGIVTQAGGTPDVGAGVPFRALAIASGGLHSCARLDDGRVKCWGANSSGQLGVGDGEDRSDDPTEVGDALPAVDLGECRQATQLALGGSHSCALLDNGQVKCWGSNSSGQLGIGDTRSRGDNSDEMGDNLPAVDLGPGRFAVQITAGGRHTCARLDTNSVKCWGDNRFGQLGQQDLRNRGDNFGELGRELPAIQLGGNQPLVGLASGTNHNCALLGNGTLKCWGNNELGQLGLGDLENRGDGLLGTLPTELDEMGDALPGVVLDFNRKILQIDAGTSHSCGRLDNGLIKCWGSNFFGQLGQGDSVDRGDDPAELGDNLAAINLGQNQVVSSLRTGGSHTCAVLGSGRLKCWGNNDFGQLGLGDTRLRGRLLEDMGEALPAVELGGRAIKQLAPGDNHTCVLFTNGTVGCWGDNDRGQLGIGSRLNRGDQPNELGTRLRLVDFGVR